MLGLWLLKRKGLKMGISKINDEEKEVIYEALANYQELVEGTILTNQKIGLEDLYIYQKRLDIIEYLLEAFR